LSYLFELAFNPFWQSADGDRYRVMDLRIQIWSIANSSLESRQLLLDLYTDPRIIPYEVQYARPYKTWTTELFQHLMQVQLDDNEQVKAMWGTYGFLIKVSHPQRQTTTYFWYNGSATGAFGSHGLFGLYSRLINVRERTMVIGKGMPREGFIQMRKARKALFVHEIGIMPNASTKYYKTSQFPVVTEKAVLQFQLKYS